MKNFLTIDWEEWCDTKSLAGWRGVQPKLSVLSQGTERILQLIRPHKATFFVLACHARRHSDMLRQISLEGHEIALHGLHHASMDQYLPERFSEDIKTAKKIVEDIIGLPVKGFRAPNFSMRREHFWALPMLAAAGFEYDSSMSDEVYGEINRAERQIMAEVPRSGVRWGPCYLPVGGGFFLRAYPYCWTRSVARALNKQGQRFLIYLHPWEFETEWRCLKGLPYRAHFVMGQGVVGIEAKVQSLMREFSFGSVKEVMLEEDRKKELR